MRAKTSYNFLGLSKQFTDYKKSKIVILPVPYEKTSTWQKGSKKGPKAILEASQQVELYDIETDFEVYKLGIFTEKQISALDPQTLIRKVYQKVKSLLLDKKFVVTLGGEHTVALGAIKAHLDFFRNFTALHLDAHLDSRDIYEGSKYNHACVLARIREMTENIVSVGVRSMDVSELTHLRADKVFYAEKIRKMRNFSNLIKKILSKLSPNVYITLDLDVFDPGIMSSVGTPEPGGLDWYQVLDLLKTVFEKKNVVGFDVVELCPSQNKAPDFLTSKLIYKLLSYKFLKERR